VNCEKAKQQIADFLGGQLPRVVDLEFQAHLVDCAGCRQETEEARRLWAALGDISAIEPGPNLRARFYETLEAFEQGAQQHRERPAATSWRWWPRQPALQFALSAACLVAGLAAGYGLHRDQKGTEQMSQLREEVTNMRQLVTLSLLQQQSASDRLRGVTWSYRVPQSDMEVLGALLRTINQDANVNVRLSAVDALRNFGDSPVARKGAGQALAKQSSPLVQIAIIDLLMDLRDREAVPFLKDLLRKPQTDENVRKRIESALQQLG
jgi:hypothetical protein